MASKDDSSTSSTQAQIIHPATRSKEEQSLPAGALVGLHALCGVGPRCVAAAEALDAVKRRVDAAGRFGVLYAEAQAALVEALAAARQAAVVVHGAGADATSWSLTRRDDRHDLRVDARGLFQVVVSSAGEAVPRDTWVDIDFDKHSQGTAALGDILVDGVLWRWGALAEAASELLRAMMATGGAVPELMSENTALLHAPSAQRELRDQLGDPCDGAVDAIK